MRNPYSTIKWLRKQTPLRGKSLARLTVPRPPGTPYFAFTKYAPSISNALSFADPRTYFGPWSFAET